MPQDARPEQLGTGILRSKDVLRLIDEVVLNAETTTYTSKDFPCGAYRRFALFLRTLSSGTPTTVQYKVQFLNANTGLWHDYNQGPFASLYYEDGDTSTEVDDCYDGEVLGRAIRVVAVGTGTGASDTFTVSAAVDLRS